MMEDDAGVVLFSGGQDSTTCLAWALAFELGGDSLVEVIRERTHTCYLGNRSDRRDWGYGCGTCPACLLRAQGRERWVAAGRASSEPRRGVS